MTFGDLVDLCQVALGDTSSTTESQIKWGIVRAIDVYKTQRFSWNRIHWELTTTAADDSYATIGKVDSADTFTPSQVFSIDSAYYLLDSRHYPVHVVGIEDALYWGESEDTGPPEGVAVGTGQFKVYPVPDDEYDIRGVAVVDVNKTTGTYTEITVDAADASLNPWIDNASKMLQSHALAEVFKYYRRDPKWAGIYEADARQEFLRHVQDYERREVQGRVPGYYGARDYGYFVY